MNRDVIQELVSIFSRFPGTGPRQARRFVYHLLNRRAGDLDQLARLIVSLKNLVSQCPSCFRFSPVDQKMGEKCALCRNPNRDQNLLMIIEKDADLESMEKSHSYQGRYFVLGGLVPLMEEQPETRVRIKELLIYLKNNPIKEVIIALAANLEGDNTADYLRNALIPFLDQGLTITILGRGLSSGIELEYSDPDTLKHALAGRTKF